MDLGYGFGGEHGADPAAAGRASVATHGPQMAYGGNASVAQGNGFGGEHGADPSAANIRRAEAWAERIGLEEGATCPGCNIRDRHGKVIGWDACDVEFVPGARGVQGLVVGDKWYKHGQCMRGRLSRKAAKKKQRKK